jgi:NitT/TauT family transport system substrate-binding protein
MQTPLSRRDFLAAMSAAGAVGMLGGRISLADEGPPETPTIRLYGRSSICEAPSCINEELLRAEGFTDVRYLLSPAAERDDAVARGVIDFTFFPPASVVVQLDVGEPVIALAGVHTGCYELFAHEPIRTISDLKGRSVGIRTFNSAVTCSSRSWRSTLGSIPARTSTGS